MLTSTRWNYTARERGPRNQLFFSFPLAHPFSSLLGAFQILVGAILWFSPPHRDEPDQASAAKQSVACLPERAVARLERGHKPVSAKCSHGEQREGFERLE